MKERVGVGRDTVADAARFRLPVRRIDRHIDHDRSADNVVAGDAADEAAIQRIAAIVAHDEETVRRNGVGKDVFLAFESPAEKKWLAWFRGADGVVFAQ